MAGHRAPEASRNNPARFCLAALVLGFAGCAQTPVEQCSTEYIGSLPTIPAYNFLVVPVALGDKPATMMIDTGAEGSLIAEGSETRLGLDHDPHRFTNLYAIGGTYVRVQNVIVPSIRFGDRATGELSLPVGKLPGPLESLDPPVAGIIGLDVLRPFDLDIDRPAHQVGFYLSSGCNDDAPNWKQPAARINLLTATNGLLMAPVIVNGVRLDAVIDTGARRSAISKEALSRLGLDDASLASDPGDVGQGIDLLEVHGHVHRFDTFQVGPTVYHNVRLDAGGTHLAIGEMLLGEDFFHGHRFWFSPSSATAFVLKPRPRPQPQPAAVAPAIPVASNTR